MSINATPSNDQFSYAPIFDSHMLETSTALAEADRAAATRYLTRNAPDLLGMILGGAA
jgi:hypothetical protein